VSDTEGGYESWGEREIRLRVPDGAGTGLIELRGASGLSTGVNAELSPPQGRRALRENREYIVEFGADLLALEAAPPNALYLAMPLPVQLASQRVTRVISRSAEPFVEDRQGTALYKFSDLSSGESRSASMSLVVSVYAVETQAVSASQTQNTALPVYKSYLGGTALIPASDEAVVTKAGTIVGRERSPYTKARLIYNAILKELVVTTDEGKSGTSSVAQPALTRLVTTLATGAAVTTDSYGASLLFCALCRAAGIPAAPIAGVLVIDDRQAVKHCWAAFWLDGLGWLPVDLALAAGTAPDGFTLRPDHAAWYFSSVDNRRIAFSFGENILTPLENGSRVVSREREYALQTIWEEASGGVESYSSLWSGVNISGVYYH
jgi:hypothetical protein